MNLKVLNWLSSLDVSRIPVRLLFNITLVLAITSQSAAQTPTEAGPNSGEVQLKRDESRPTASSVNKNTFLSVRASRERLGATHLIVGRVKNGVVEVFAGQNYLRQTLAKVKAESAPSAANSTAVKKNAPTTPPPPPGLMLVFDLPAAQVKACSKQREFRSFLSQVQLFKEHLEEFEITATSKRFATCAATLAQQIIEKGYRTNITFTELPLGGISIRAGFDKPALAQAPSASPGGVQTDLPPEKPREPILYAEVIHSNFRRRTELNSEGYFVFSFDNPVQNAQLDVGIGIKPLASIRPVSSQRLPLGESQVQIFEEKYVTVVAATLDSVSREAVPEQILQAALEDLDEQRRRFSTSVGARVENVAVNGSGVPAQDAITMRLSFRHRITERFFLDAEGAVPFAISGPYPWNHIRSRLNYWLVGAERERTTRGSQRFNLGIAGGFFFLQNKLRGEAQNASTFVMTELLGVTFGSKAELRLQKDLTLSLMAEVSPEPAAQGTKSSLSKFVTVGADKCFSQVHCVTASLANESYQTNVLNAGSLSLNAQIFSLGYRRVLK